MLQREYLLWVKQTFSDSIHLIFIEKQVNSEAVVVLAVLGTREHVDFRKVFGRKTF